MKPGWLPGSRSIFIAIERNMEMERIKPRTLSGFMELLPAPQMQMERMLETLRRTYSLYGFTPLDTPVIESAEVLLAKGGGETEKQIYRFTKGDADLALRFDLTVPLAKYVALHANELSFPFRRYQIGRSTGENGRSEGGSGNFTRRILISLETANWTFSTKRRFRRLFIRPSGLWA